MEDGIGPVVLSTNVWRKLGVWPWLRYLNFYRASTVSNVLMFDHGGSDILKLFASFGLFGTFAVFYLIFSTTGKA